MNSKLQITEKIAFGTKKMKKYYRKDGQMWLHKYKTYIKTKQKIETCKIYKVVFLQKGLKTIFKTCVYEGRVNLMKR